MLLLQLHQFGKQKLFYNKYLIKFKGTKLPGGIELNGREIYDDAVQELADIKEAMSTEYELPPLDFIG